MDSNSANPLNLRTSYTWQPGDTMMLVALKYRRLDQWLELVDLNKILLSQLHYHLRVGDVIRIPENWFPLPTPTFETKYRGSSIHGERI